MKKGQRVEFTMLYRADREQNIKIGDVGTIEYVYSNGDVDVKIDRLNISIYSTCKQLKPLPDKPETIADIPEIDVDALPWGMVWDNVNDEKLKRKIICKINNKYVALIGAETDLYMWNHCELITEPEPTKHEPITWEKYHGKTVEIKHGGHIIRQLLIEMYDGEWVLKYIANQSPAELAALIDKGEVKILD